ncbi:MAG: LuxR C-terminal-related transcriptional regulator [Geminicoccaceae bacterium]
MMFVRNKDGPVSLALIALVVVQTLTSVFFIADVFGDLGEYGREPTSGVHLVIEAIAVAGLVAAIALECAFIRHLLNRKARLESSLQTAQSAVHDVIESHFERWKLTPAERDVASLLVKGLNTAEIANIRGSAEGTVKAQLNAIYRKSDARSRTDLLSHIIDGLMGGERSAEPDDITPERERALDAGAI